MEINWFPGHMNKSMREIENNLGVSDCVVYVLDARAVLSCFNPSFDAKIDIPIVYVLNKADIAPLDVVNGWLNKLSGAKSAAISTDGTDVSTRKRLITAIKSVCAETIARQKRRGLNEHLRAIVLGVPNTGKSTIINTLCGKARLNTGDRAGVTRSAAWCRVDNTLDVLDTPGTLYPKISDIKVGENLAIIGSIKDEVVDTTELACALVSRLRSIAPTAFEARYGFDINSVDDDYSALEQITQKRGFKIRGGSADVERAAAAVIDDFRKCRLGKIALERCDG